MVQKKSINGESETETATERRSVIGAKKESVKSSLTTAENVSVAENLKESSSPLTIKITTGITSAENISPKLGNSHSKEDCRTTIKSSATTATTPKPISEYARTRKKIDLITGGFPCQPFSVAGKQRGKEDDRALWPEIVRLLRELSSAERLPTWCLFENVFGIVAMELDSVLSDLESIGYSAWTLVIPACAVDARHRRDRVWILGYAKHARLTPAEIGGSIGTRNDDSASRTEQASEPAGSSEQLPSLAHANRGRFSECASEAEPIHGTGFAGESNRETSADADGRKARKSSERQRREDSVGRSDDKGRAADTGRKSDGGYCRWQPEPAVGRSLNGLSAGLDRNRLILESHKLLLDYGKTTNQRPDQIMSALRDSITPQNIQWTAGGCTGISAAQILLAYLCELEACPFDEARIQLACAETLEASLRSVRTGNKPSRASSRPRHQQQCAGEHPDTLQAMSRLLAQHSQKAWQISRWQDASTLPWGAGWEVGTPRVANGIPNRVDRLKGLGNAIVPQVACEIIRCMVSHQRHKI